MLYIDERERDNFQSCTVIERSGVMNIYIYKDRRKECKNAKRSESTNSVNAVGLYSSCFVKESVALEKRTKRNAASSRCSIICTTSECKLKDTHR